MKKIKNIFASILLILCCFCYTSVDEISNIYSYSYYGPHIMPPPNIDIEEDEKEDLDILMIILGGSYQKKL